MNGHKLKSHEQSKSGTKRSGFNRKWLSICFGEIPVEMFYEEKNSSSDAFKRLPSQEFPFDYKQYPKQSLFVKNIKVIIASFQLFSLHMFLFVENPDTLVHSCAAFLQLSVGNVMSLVLL